MGNDDLRGLSDLYYAINDCLVTLKQLNYTADLQSSDTLRQAVQRLPQRLHTKWAERSLVIRRYEEPSLQHLGRWLQDRLMAQKEAYMPDHQTPRKKKEDPLSVSSHSTTVATRTCRLCSSDHGFWKCPKYKALPPNERAEMVKELKVCTNCFNDGHQVAECTSPISCFESGCGKRHHTTLHEVYAEKDTKPIQQPKKRFRKKKGKAEGADGVGTESKTEDVKVSSHLLLNPAPKVVFLLIVPVSLHIGSITFDTYALLDDGSTGTFITQRVVEELGVTGEPQTCSLGTLTEQPKLMSVSQISLEVSARDGSNRLEIESALVQPAEKFNMPSRPRLEDIRDDDVYTSMLLPLKK